MQRPLITDAAGLAPYLRNVNPYNHNGYHWSADPPCHTSSSGAASSFHFGDAEGGGVKVGCWAGCQGPGFVRRIEEALGIRLQVNVGGKLTHEGAFPGKGPSVRNLPPRPAKPPALGDTVLPATPAEGPITLEDWFAGLFWFVGAGNKGSRKHVATWSHNGATWTFRHSKLPEEGGVNLARFSGRLPDGQRVHPWASFEVIEALIAETPELRESERRPCVSFAGDADTHHPMPIGCVDGDFKPDKDTDGIGAAFTAHVRQGLIDAGCPVYSSTSWNGFHALWRLEPWQDGKLHAPVNGGKRFRAWPSNARTPFHGARVEVFAPATRSWSPSGAPDRLRTANPTTSFPCCPTGKSRPSSRRPVRQPVVKRRNPRSRKKLQLLSLSRILSRSPSPNLSLSLSLSLNPNLSRSRNLSRSPNPNLSPNRNLSPSRNRKATGWPSARTQTAGGRSPSGPSRWPA